MYIFDLNIYTCIHCMLTASSVHGVMHGVTPASGAVPQPVVVFDTGTTVKLTTRGWVKRHAVELTERRLAEPKILMTASRKCVVHCLATLVCFLQDKHGRAQRWTLTDVHVHETEQVIPLLLGIPRLEVARLQANMNFATGVLDLRYPDKRSTSIQFETTARREPRVRS